MKFDFDESHVKKMNRLIFLIGFLKIRMIGYTKPRVVSFTQDRFVLKVRLRKRTMNHFKSMYFGALAVGADLAAGLPAFYLARLAKINLSLVFKDMSAEFLRRPDSDVYFVVEDSMQYIRFIEEVKQSTERQTKGIHIQAFTFYGQQNQELVATFTLGLSLKAK